MVASTSGVSSSKNLASIQNAITRLHAANAASSPLASSYGDTGNQSFADQALSKLSPLMDLADTGLNIAERPAQAILHGLSAFSGKGTHTLDPSTLEAAAKGALHGLTNVSGSDNYNLRKTMNLDPNVGGRLAGLFDTIGTSAIDPLTYVSGGTSAVGKTGLKIIAEKVGPDVAKAVADNGIKTLGKPTQDAIRAAIASSDQAGNLGKNAGKFTDKVMGELHDGTGLKIKAPGLSPNTLIKSSTLRPVAEAAHIPQALDALRATGAAKLARQAFVPLAKATDLVGQKTAGKLADVLRQGRASATNGSTDAVTQVRSAMKASGLKMPEIQHALGHLVEGTDMPTDLSPHQLNLANAVKQIGSNATEAKQSAIAEGLRTGQLPTDAAQGIDRLITPEAKKAIGQNPTTIARTLGLDASATPANIIAHLKQALPNENLAAANERLSPLVGVKNALETNPLKVLTESAVQSHRDAATAETLHGLMNVMDEQGKPLISTVQRPGDVGKETILGHVYGPKEILDELNHAGVTLTDDHALNRLGEVMDSWSKLWRGYATVPVLFGLGFHERNLVGNVFNMWLNGFHNPALFKTSSKIIQAIEKGTNSGLTVDDAIEQAKNLSPEERQQVRQAYKEGVVNDSFFRTDQATTPSVDKSGFQKVKEAANPVNPNNAVLRSGQYIGRKIEDNSRLAMFIDQMQKHGDPQIAADNVKKSLFDYSELTPTEQKLKRVMPFYTYMRKNTPLQIQAMLKNPGKFSQVAHARDNLLAGAPDTGGQPVPQYALQNGSIPLLGGDEPVLGNLNLPFQSAAQNIQPLLQILSQGKGVPSSLKTEGGSGPAFQQIVSNLGGGPVEVAKWMAQTATGKNLFTGQNVKGNAGANLLKSLLPLAGKGQSTVTKLSGDSSQRNAQLLNMLAGLQTTALTPNATGAEEARRSAALQTLAKGTPTTAALRKLGQAPKAVRKVKGKAGVLPKASKAKGSLPKPPKPKA